MPNSYSEQIRNLQKALLDGRINEQMYEKLKSDLVDPKETHTAPQLPYSEEPRVASTKDTPHLSTPVAIPSPLTNNRHDINKSYGTSVGRLFRAFFLFYFACLLCVGLSFLFTCISNHQNPDTDAIYKRVVGKNIIWDDLTFQEKQQYSDRSQEGLRRMTSAMDESRLIRKKYDRLSYCSLAMMAVTGWIAIILGCIKLYNWWEVIQDGQARTTPGKAVGFLFIPLFWVFWTFVAFVGLAIDVNRFALRYRQPISPVSPGMAIVFSALITLWPLLWIFPANGYSGIFEILFPLTLIGFALISWFFLTSLEKATIAIRQNTPV